MSVAEQGASSPSTPPQRPRRSSGIVVPRKLTWRHKLAAFLIAAAVRIVSGTWRCRFVDTAGALEGLKAPAIAALWHNRLALTTVIWNSYAKYKCPAPGLVGLISASHDGGILSRALKYFGIEAARGSSSRRGAQALLELTTWLDRGYHVAITPDGPRGPRYVVQDGIIALAQLTGLPILPISSSVRGKWTAKSWDRFQIPFPFARCEIRFGEPLWVPREMTPEQRENLKRELERRMQAITTD